MKLAVENSRANNKSDFLKDLEATAQRLMEARTSMVAITSQVARFMHYLYEAPEEKLEMLRSLACSMGDKLIRDSEEATLKAASPASAIIEDGDRVMSCSHSSTIRQVFRIARDAGKAFHVVVAESRTADGRAYGETAAQELSSLGISAEIVPDDSIGHAISAVAKIMVGADTILQDGSLINGMPTGKVALAARKANVPFYTVCETSKLDLWHSPSYRAKLEEGFDRVPANLITGIVTEAGMVKPDEVVKYMTQWAALVGRHR